MTKKKDGSRFDDLFGAVKGRGEEPSQQPSERKKAKGTDPDYVRTTVYLPKRLHRKLKAAALSEEREMSEIVEDLVSQWLESRESDV